MADFYAGQRVRFSGHSADNRVNGDMDVNVVHPHSNGHLVTKTEGSGKKLREYEGASRHIRTATVKNDRGTQFEAFHHTLSPKASDAGNAQTGRNEAYNVLLGG